MSRSLLLPKFFGPKLSPPTRLYLIKALPAVCLLALPLPSWAGQWAVTYSSTGTYSYDSVGPGGTMPAHNGPVNTQTGGWNYSPAGYVDAQTTASVTATLSWQPASGKTTATDPPPPSSQPVFIKEVAVAEEIPGSWYGPGPAPSPAGTASDSLGDAPQAWGRGYLCTGTHLIQKDGSSGVITLDAVSLSAACPQTSLVNGNPDWLWTDFVTVNLTVATDTRGVTISANVDVTNAKSPAYNPDGSVEFDAYNNIVFVPVPHTPSADGTMYGDYGIGYGSSYIPGDPDPDDLYPVKYTANLAGTWGAGSTYNWYSSLKSSGGGGPTFTNVYIGAAALPQDSGPPLINPGETSKVDHIHLTVTDSNDGATGTANYYMALHQPDEFLPSNQATETITKDVEDVEASSPGWASPSIGVNCTWNSPGAYWDYLAGGADVMAEIPGADEALPWFGAFCAAAGVAVDHLKPLPCTGPASFYPIEKGSDFPDEALHPFAATDPTYFVMIPHFHELYTRTHLLRDIWATTGFVSETPINSDVFVRVSGAYGTYKYQVTAPAVK